MESLKQIICNIVKDAMESINERLKFFAQSDEYLDQLRELLDKEFNKNPIVDDEEDDTVLHVAAKSSRSTVKIIQELINAEVNVNKPNGNGFLPLHYTVIYRKYKEFEALFQCTILVNHKNIFGETALHYAVHNEKYKRFERHFKSGGADMRFIEKILSNKFIIIDEKDDFGKTPLMWAIQDRRLDVVNVLLKKGSSLLVADFNKQTPLHLALTGENICPYIISQIIFDGAGLNEKDKRGQTPLDMIIQSGIATGSYRLAHSCLKVIVLKYHLFNSEKVMAIPELSGFLKKCRDEVQRMRLDTIGNSLTVLDFLRKSDSKSSFDKPLIEVYKPVVKKLISGLYQEYFHFLLKRISTSTLSKLLKIMSEDKSKEIESTATNLNIMAFETDHKENVTESSTKLFSLNFKADSELLTESENIVSEESSPKRIRLAEYGISATDSKECKGKLSADLFVDVVRIVLYKYLSHSDIFCLFGALPGVTINESVRQSLEDKFYLINSWTEYPDDYVF